MQAGPTLEACVCNGLILPTSVADCDTPLSTNEFINPALNRYGQGCNVLIGFGNKYTIKTREVSVASAASVHWHWWRLSCHA